MALHRARPGQRSNTACLEARNRSVSPRPCPGAPPFCPTQELSRTPQTRPINDKPPTQTCWSAACAYARGSQNRQPMVAGENTDPPITKLRAGRLLGLTHSSPRLDLRKVAWPERPNRTRWPRALRRAGDPGHASRPRPQRSTRCERTGCRTLGQTTPAP